MRASRLVSLLLMLQTRGQVSAPELATHFGLSVRTIHRDLEALAAAGVPIETTRGPAGGYRLAGGYRTRLTGLTWEEAETLFLAGLPGPVAELGLGTALATAQLKLLAALPGELREHAALAGELFHVDAPGWFRSEEKTPHLAIIANALWELRRLDARYRLRDKVVRRVLDPLGLVLKAGVWYLVARAKDSVRVYRVSRFANLRARDETFERPPDFDLAEFWGQRTKEFERSRPEIEVRLRATKAGAKALGWLLPGEKAAIGAAADAAAAEEWIALTLPFEDLEHAYGDLIGLGPEVEVLEPSELRARLTEAARQMAMLYTR